MKRPDRFPRNDFRHESMPVHELWSTQVTMKPVRSDAWKVNALRGVQSQSQEELDALLPSILDKAFKGEL